MAAPVLAQPGGPPGRRLLLTAVQGGVLWVLLFWRTPAAARHYAAAMQLRWALPGADSSTAYSGQGLASLDCSVELPTSRTGVYLCCREAGGTVSTGTFSLVVVCFCMEMTAAFPAMHPLTSWAVSTIVRGCIVQLTIQQHGCSWISGVPASCRSEASSVAAPFMMDELLALLH